MNVFKMEVIKTAEALHKSSHGIFKIVVYRNEVSRKEHAVLIKGDVNDKNDVPVRIESDCITGIVLDSLECECKDQLKGSFDILSKSENGLIIYLRDEGRGHGLTIKVKALANKNKGHDTLEAVEKLGLATDIRDYKDAANIIKDLGINSVKLITNNPDKIAKLREHNVIVSDRIPIEIPVTEHTRKHLKAKRDKANHFFNQEL